MKAVITKGLWPRMRLTVGERDEPHPGDHQVLVKVQASSVNPKDWKLNRTLAACLSPLESLRIRPLFGDDLAGVIVGVGRQVTDWRIGDAVYGMDMRLSTAALAEFAVINTRRIARMPGNLTFSEAASAPLAAQTALQGLRKGGASAGSRVLVIGASGGVGTFAVQIARIMGCHVTGVCSTRNLELVRSLGAHEVIDYTTQDFLKGSAVFDVVFDVTSYETPASCARLMGPQGRFVSTSGNARALMGTLLSRRSRACIVKVESYRKDLETLTAWFESGKLRPIIDSAFPMDDAEGAYARSRSGRAQGKIVIEAR